MVPCDSKNGNSTSKKDSLEKILLRIITVGRKQMGDRQYVSELLLGVMTGFKELNGLRRIYIEEETYVEVDSIPDEVRNAIGLFTPLPTSSNEARNRRLKMEYGVDFDTSPPKGVTPRKEGSEAEWDVERAIAKAKDYHHEFIDYFTDINEIETKSMTLSILVEIKPYKADLKYLKSAYENLKSRNVKCELPIDRFREFYKKLNWFFRVGLVNGCININKNPL